MVISIKVQYDKTWLYGTCHMQLFLLALTVYATTNSYHHLIRN